MVVVALPCVPSSCQGILPPWPATHKDDKSNNSNNIGTSTNIRTTKTSGNHRESSSELHTGKEFDIHDAGNGADDKGDCASAEYAFDHSVDKGSWTIYNTSWTYPPYASPKMFVARAMYSFWNTRRACKRCGMAGCLPSTCTYQVTYQVKVDLCQPGYRKRQERLMVKVDENTTNSNDNNKNNHDHRGGENGNNSSNADYVAHNGNIDMNYWAFQSRLYAHDLKGIKRKGQSFQGGEDNGTNSQASTLLDPQDAINHIRDFITFKSTRSYTTEGFLYETSKGRIHSVQDACAIPLTTDRNYSTNQDIDRSEFYCAHSYEGSKQDTRGDVIIQYETKDQTASRKQHATIWYLFQAFHDISNNWEGMSFTTTNGGQANDPQHQKQQDNIEFKKNNSNFTMVSNDMRVGSIQCKEQLLPYTRDYYKKNHSLIKGILVDDDEICRRNARIAMYSQIDLYNEESQHQNYDQSRIITEMNFHDQFGRFVNRFRLSDTASVNNRINIHSNQQQEQDDNDCSMNLYHFVYDDDTDDHDKTMARHGLHSVYIKRNEKAFNSTTTNGRGGTISCKLITTGTPKHRFNVSSLVYTNPVFDKVKLNRQDMTMIQELIKRKNHHPLDGSNGLLVDLRNDPAAIQYETNDEGLFPTKMMNEIGSLMPYGSVYRRIPTLTSPGQEYDHELYQRQLQNY